MFQPSLYLAISAFCVQCSDGKADKLINYTAFCMYLAFRICSIKGKFC